MFFKIKRDISMSFSGDSLIYAVHPRLLPVMLFRASSYLSKCPIPILSYVFYYSNLILFGLDISRKAKIGGGLMIHHPNGIVIGEDSVIGENCIVHQGVLLGARGSGHQSGDPIVGDNVLLGSGAKLIGAIKIANYTKIGANAVVLTDIDKSGSVVVGNPAKVVKIRVDV